MLSIKILIEATAKISGLLSCEKKTKKSKNESQKIFKQKSNSLENF